MTGTVPVNNSLLTGTVPVNDSLLTRTIFFLKRGKGEGPGGKGRQGNFPLASVGSRDGGDNRKRVHRAQRRVGPKARLAPLWPGCA